MDILVTVTRENTRVFPMHSHAVWEVMLYTAGAGALKTDAGDFHFHADTVIAVPPHLRHGSCADSAFVNICVHAPLPLGEERVRVIERADGKIRALFELTRDCHFEGGETAGVLPPQRLQRRTAGRFLFVDGVFQPQPEDVAVQPALRLLLKGMEHGLEAGKVVVPAGKTHHCVQIQLRVAALVEGGLLRLHIVASRAVPDLVDRPAVL